MPDLAMHAVKYNILKFILRCIASNYIKCTVTIFDQMKD